jgi:hypothetical protein
MAASPLSNESMKAHPTDAESGVRANSSEAARLYQRGVTAARAGQKRIAAGYLTRSVQLNPHSEGAWLWLSGVLEDPNQVAFCLQSVLKLNPQNERAQRGLRWLQERHTLKAEPPSTGTSRLPQIDAPQPQQPATQARPAHYEPREQSDSWWVSWRHWRREAVRVNLMWWSLPIIVLLIALAINRTFAMAVEESASQPVRVQASLPAQPGADTPADVEGNTSFIQILDADTSSVRESQTLAYLDSVEPLRQNLRDAVDTYRANTGQPGAAMDHIASAQAFLDSVRSAYQAMQQMSPPQELYVAHNEYLMGLEYEMAAINDLLEFYGSYRTEHANRAVTRFQAANSHFDRAQSLFSARLQQIGAESTISVHTIR